MTVYTNVIKLQLPTPIRIHIVVNVSQIVKYREQVERQKVKEVKLVEVENILNKKNKRSGEIFGMMKEVYSRK